jgi:hypothetical protein
MEGNIAARRKKYSISTTQGRQQFHKKSLMFLFPCDKKPMNQPTIAWSRRTDGCIRDLRFIGVNQVQRQVRISWTDNLVYQAWADGDVAIGSICNTCYWKARR